MYGGYQWWRFLNRAEAMDFSPGEGSAPLLVNDICPYKDGTKMSRMAYRAASVSKRQKLPARMREARYVPLVGGDRKLNSDVRTAMTAMPMSNAVAKSLIGRLVVPLKSENMTMTAANARMLPTISAAAMPKKSPSS